MLMMSVGSANISELRGSGKAVSGLMTWMRGMFAWKSGVTMIVAVA